MMVVVVVEVAGRSAMCHCSSALAVGGCYSAREALQHGCPAEEMMKGLWKGKCSSCRGHQTHRLRSVVGDIKMLVPGQAGAVLRVGILRGKVS